MAEAVLTGNAQVRKRKSYAREEKLRIVNSYYENGKNLYQTCKTFSMNSKTVLRWIKDEEKIRKSKKGSKRVKFVRSAQYPVLEERLHGEYKELQKKGLKVKNIVGYSYLYLHGLGARESTSIHTCV